MGLVRVLGVGARVSCCQVLGPIVLLELYAELSLELAP